MIASKHYLCVFKSRNHALLIFNLFEEEGKDTFQLVSTPCGLQAGCGYSIRFFHKGYMDIILKKVNENNIPIPKFYFVDKINGNIKYREIKQKED
ncbi:MAG: DUF3343 domain-containing protein [Tissierellaceae bacterium]|nr:DUF3343 domain-containing protein [Tissierellaceae bacterium]